MAIEEYRASVSSGFLGSKLANVPGPFQPSGAE